MNHSSPILLPSLVAATAVAAAALSGNVRAQAVDPALAAAADPALAFERAAQFETVEQNLPAALEQYRLAAAAGTGQNHATLRAEAEVAIARCLLKQGQTEDARATLEGLSAWMKQERARPAADPNAPEGDTPGSLKVNGRVYLPAEALPGLERLQEAVETIKAAGSTDREKLISAAIEGMAGTLGKNSGYRAPDSLEVSELTPLVGVGMMLSAADGGFAVRDLIAGSPAYRAKIPQDSKILEIDGKTPFAFGGKLTDVVAAIRGPKGTPVRLLLQFPDDSVHDMTLTREIIASVDPGSCVPLPSAIANSWWLDEAAGIAGVAIESIRPDAYDDLVKILTGPELTRTPIRGFILDLRENGGGAPEATALIADAFLKEGVIASFVSRNGEVEPRMADAAELLPGVPVVVLVDAATASGAEVIAAALQDNGRAVIMGERTFGRGEILTASALAGGGALIVPDGERLRPSGKPLERREGMTEADEWGVTPDIASAPLRPEPAAKPADEPPVSLWNEPENTPLRITTSKPTLTGSEQLIPWKKKLALDAQAVAYLKSKNGAR